MFPLFSRWFKKERIENKRHTCTHCGKKFNWFWEWEVHDYDHHDPDGPMEPLED